MIHNINNRFIQNLVNIRKMCGLSQTEMSKRCRCTKANISAFEVGKSTSGKILIEYLKLCNTPSYIEEVVKHGKGTDQTIKEH